MEPDTERKCLSLRPISAAIQRVAVYETRTWLYVVGSTNDGTSCRLLKIDRTFPSPSHPQLEVDEGDVEYTEGEIKDLLIMLDDGNKYSANKYRTHGLKQVASAFGIIGFIRFLEGYYIVLITKRKPVAIIGGHVIYKIEDTAIYPVSNTTSKPTNPDEGRYLKIFQNVDLSSNFYFSYSYDLTLSLQCQMRTNPGPAPPSCRKFVWNDHLLKQLEGFVHSKWVLHIIHGFFGQYNISVYGRPIYLTLIARRSKEYAGTRFLKRGANDEGHVANEVETEQLVHDASSQLHSNGGFTSYIQLRGSVPSFWSQDLTGIKPKPQITIDRSTPFATPAALHFIGCLKRFGSPIICLNLVKKRERRARESLLTNELLTSINYLNQFLPPENHIQYIHKDMARINKSKAHNLMQILDKIAYNSVKATGFFHSGSELYCNKLHPHPDYKAIGGYGYRDDYIGRDQTGVLRVNCVDCLDRTNTAQFVAGKCAIGYQLYALGVLPEPQVPFDCEAIRMLEEAYEDLGDTLAVQYGGSQLVHRIQTYRKVAPVANHGRDIYQTIQRYIRNAFTDADKQMAINVFLGVFEPQEGAPNIWELSTDYYLHHTQARVPPSMHSTQSHTKWWNDRLLASLPLPQLEVEDEEESAPSSSPPAPPAPSHGPDGFDEVYKPYELTDFDTLFGRNILRTADHDPSDASPFVVKLKPKRKLHKSGAVRSAQVGLPGMEGDSPSSGESSSEEDSVLSQPLDPKLSLHNSSQSPVPAEGGTLETYGFEIKEPSLEDSLLYRRYARIHSTACMPGPEGDVELTSEEVNSELAQWEPTYPYKEDSVFGIEPPVVSPEDERIYELSVRVATRGPTTLPTASVQLYAQYADMAWRTGVPARHGDSNGGTT